MRQSKFFAMAAALAAVFVMASSAVAAAQSWPCGANGSNLTCTYEDYILTVSGSGRMMDYDNPSGNPCVGTCPPSAPWGQVLGIVIEDGVTYTGKYAFNSGAIQGQIFIATVSATNPPEVHENAFRNVNFADAILRVPVSSVSAYSVAPVWKDFGNINKYTVTFNSQGGSNINPQFVSYGSKANKPDDPIKSTYTLEGWYKNYLCSGATGECTYIDKYDFNAETVTSDITLFAKWVSTTSVITKNPVSAKPFSVSVDGASLRIVGASQATPIRIYNLNGKLLMSRSAMPNELISVSHLARGTYVVKALGNSVRIVR